MKLLHSLSYSTALLAVAAVHAATEGKPLSPGAPVPAVTVHADTGAEAKLREMIAAKPAVLIFYRGGQGDAGPARISLTRPVTLPTASPHISQSPPPP